MKTKLFLLTIAFFTSFNLFSQLEQIYVETIYHDGIEIPSLEGQTTYRIYAQLSDSLDQIYELSGTDECTLNISTSTQFLRPTFFTEPFSCPYLHCIITELFDMFPEFKFTSGVTIGVLNDSYTGVPFSTNSNGYINSPLGSSISGVEPSDQWENFAHNGDDFILGSSADAWFLSAPGNPNGFGHGDLYSVLLGQFTTDGIFSFNLNLKVYSSENGINIPYQYQSCDGIIPSLSYVSGSCTSPTACNYNPEATEDDGSCEFPGDSCNDGNDTTALELFQDDCSCGGGVPAGCTDPEACNYDDTAEVENGACIFTGDSCSDGNSQTTNDIYLEDCNCLGELLGCTDNSACNYNENASSDDGSCIYAGDICDDNFTNANYNETCECAYHLIGIAFEDVNINGIFDEGDIPLAEQLVEIEALGISTTTNDEGEFILEEVPLGEHTVSISYSDSWELYLTSSSQEAEVPQQTMDPIEFIVTNSDLPEPSLELQVLNWLGLPCNSPGFYVILLENNGMFPVSGTLEIELDNLLTPLQGFPQTDSINGQTAYLSFENLLAGNIELMAVEFNSPDETNIGELIESTITASAWNNGELQVITTETLTEEVTCAYDPNDITGFPLGYTDEHWVLEDTSMDYVIRFQNTGNAPASAVLVVDSLDQHMDFSSFVLTGSTHEVTADVDANGRVEFLFENINLPDSTTNEPESHGLVSFKVDFVDGITTGTELNQTAYIYFDNNPPVITNTTWHTIHECGGEAAFETSVTEICAGEAVEFTSTYPHLEDYSWVIGINEESTEASFSKTFT
ncbi:MAG: carboxypeptidase-like regulatory domain-containing protein, partial [Flavobacteriales bacterium]